MNEFSQKFVVTSTDTAKAMKSGDLEVLATPALIAKIEETAKNAILAELTSGETSVGTMIQTTHQKASKVGAEIIVHLTFEKQSARSFQFHFQAFDDGNLIAEGTHDRVVVNVARFLQKLG